MKKLIFVLVAMLLCTCANLFAYDGTIIGGIDGSFSRFEFIQQASYVNTAKKILQSVVDEFGGTITKFFLIDEDSVDPEDVQLISDVEDFIVDEEGLYDKAAYSYVIIRDSDDYTYEDGWVIMTHFLNSSGFLHYLYYFSRAL